MPRRPRPAARRPPQRANVPETKKSTPVVSRAKSPVNAKRRLHSLEEWDAEASSSGADTGHSSEEEGSVAGSSDLGSEEEGLEAGAEPDVARAAQWVDEEELDEMSDEESGSEPVEETDLEADLQTLSFGALRKAHKALEKAQVDTDSDEVGSSSDISESEEPILSAPRVDKGKEKEVDRRERKDVPKRKSKHAPTEMSSKRPVSRARFFAEEKAAPRDPRFLPVTGSFDSKKFHTQYGFLSELHGDELKTLRENLKRARKLLANSPRDLREERAEEVERLERTVKRAESMVNKDRREKVELDALSKIKQEEREKQKQGKKAWYMKDSDKKALLLRAKYDALAASGGRGAVRKAIEKKQKKVSQKEKKKRPFAPGQPAARRSSDMGEGGPSLKRPYRANGRGEGPRKRPRAS